MTQQPTVGRVVHYQSYGTPGGEYLPEARAAIITEVEYVIDTAALDGVEGSYVIDGDEMRFEPTVGDPVPAADLPTKPLVSLAVLNPTGMFFNTAVPYAEEPTPGHWNWPPRVGDTTITTVHTAYDNTTETVERDRRRRMRRYVK